MKAAVLGYGEVGSAVGKLFEQPVQIHDPALQSEFTEKMDFLHVCIPYSIDFVDCVLDHALKWKPELVIIHSSVRVGTTQLVAKSYADVVHSPVRGDHTNMLRDLRAFPKFVGADVDAAWFKAKRHFREIDLHPVQIRDSRATELAKLLDTTYYGVCIAYHEFANQLCRKEGVNFDDVMTKFNDTYNDTMAALGRENFIRPTLYPPEGPIGGHCVVPNARMLEEQYGAHDLLRPLKVGTTDD